LEPRIDCWGNEALPLGQTINGLSDKNSPSGRAMIGSVSQFFSESGKTRMRTKWFGRRQAKGQKRKKMYNSPAAAYSPQNL
jgi:hypothetical protein